MAKDRLRIYFVLGEDSGDALGADLIAELERQATERGQTIEIVGLAGERTKALGVTSLFDIEEIAVMGISAVIGRLPKIIRRVYQTVDDVVAKKPDLVLLIDSPDFTHAVARRVRKRMPHVPIVDYVCPSVWAWRSGRAAKMTAFIDHVLALLPFEPKALADLNGPSATYVGHPLARQIASMPPVERDEDDDVPILLVLPGSRGSEVKRLLKPFGKAIEIMKQRDVIFRVVVPSVPHMRALIERETANWSVDVEITSSADNDRLFPRARAAIAASGTVALQLALHRVPMVACYILDPATLPVRWMITIWSSNLPNLIVDRVLVPEEFNDMVRPGRIARYAEELLADGPARDYQLAGFAEVAERMETEQAPSVIGAGIILDHALSADDAARLESE